MIVLSLFLNFHQLKHYNMQIYVHYSNKINQFDFNSINKIKFKSHLIQVIVLYVSNYLYFVIINLINEYS